MDIHKLVGKRIREIRTSLDLTQSELAERSDLGDETISRIERGVQGLTLENLYKISKSLNLPFHSFLDIDQSDELVVKEATIRRIVNLLRRSPKKTILLTHKILRALLESEKRPS